MFSNTSKLRFKISINTLKFFYICKYFEEFFVFLKQYTSTGRLLNKSGNEMTKHYKKETTPHL